MVPGERPCQLSHIRFPNGAICDIPQPPHGENAWWGRLTLVVAIEAYRAWIMGKANWLLYGTR